MRARWQPKIWFKREIKLKNKKIGYIQLVDYLIGKTTPHLEYYLEPTYRNKKIMTKELRKYLRLLKNADVMQVLALVKEKNIASINYWKIMDL